MNSQLNLMEANIIQLLFMASQIMSAKGAEEKIPEYRQRDPFHRQKCCSCGRYAKWTTVDNLPPGENIQLLCDVHLEERIQHHKRCGDNWKITYLYAHLPDPLRPFYEDISDWETTVYLTSWSAEMKTLPCPKTYYKKPVKVTLRLYLKGTLGENYAAPSLTVYVHKREQLLDKIKELEICKMRCGSSWWYPCIDYGTTWKYACHYGALTVSCTRDIKWPLLHVSIINTESDSLFSLLPKELLRMIWRFVREM